MEIRTSMVPVEFNVSKRAMMQHDQLDLISADGHEGAQRVLRATAPGSMNRLALCED